MDADKKPGTVRIDLTPAQQAQVEQQTGKKAETIELGVEELEQRIAPRFMAL